MEVTLAHQRMARLADSVTSASRQRSVVNEVRHAQVRHDARHQKHLDESRRMVKPKKELV